MENVIIRNIRKEDIPQVVEIQVTGWQTAYRGIIDDDYLNSMNIEERIKKRNNDYHQSGFIVAEVDNVVVGFCRYVDNNSFSPDFSEIDCELTALYVRSDLKGNGIGRKMLQYVLDDFKRKNKTRMIIWCLKDNFPSRKFYEKMGGKLLKEKTVNFGNRDYLEVGFIYDI